MIFTYYILPLLKMEPPDYLQNWKSYLSCVYRVPQRYPQTYIQQSKKNIAAFDLHGTLIQSNRALPLSVTAEDWIWTGQLVPSYLNQLPIYGWDVVIFSNHKGLNGINTAMSRIERLLESLDFDPFVFIAITSAPESKKLPYYADNLTLNPMIKPNIGMWLLYFKLLNVEFKNIGNGFYCGDLGGEHGSWAFYQREATDYLFTENLNSYAKQGCPRNIFPQYSEFQVLLDNPCSIVNFHYYDPSQLLPIVVYPTFPNQQLLIIMVGQQGSGKSTMAQWLVNQHPNYVLINKENNRKYLQQIQTELKLGKTVVVDAINPTIANRKELIDTAKSLGIHSQILWSARPGYYLNKLRATPVSRIALNMYSSKFERPTPSEGAGVLRIS